jgi:5-oxoprolinase (ATP-hydrolysing) subunit A
VVLLNLDAGEYPDEPEELWALADIVSIACGGHAGDQASMTRVVEYCASSTRGARPGIGAHPSYPDRKGFGRVSMEMEPDALGLTVIAQCGALSAIASAHGQRVRWIKPHGALYHDATNHEAISRELLQGARDALGEDIVIIGPPRGWLRETANAFGLRYLREGFADRATRPDGSLVPRSEAGALITDPQLAAARARELVADVDTICVHADTPGALAIARAVRKAIDG